LNNKLKIIILTLGCFTLLGCPPVYYLKYEYAGDKSLGTDREFTLLKFNDITDIGIECGFYHQFVGDKERGLTTRIRIKKNRKFDLRNIKVMVKSSKLGELKQRELPDIPYLDSLPTLLFDKQIKIKRRNKVFKLIENDTITVEFDNGMKYQFVNK